MSEGRTEIATLGGGCFWCTEAVYERIEGVIDAVSGYSGGSVEKPTYQQVTSGRTGHAEVVQVTFDPDRVSYSEILEIFFKSHDPTTENRQGADVGTQYRSLILFHSDEQRRVAEEALEKARTTYRDPIVTEIRRFERIYEAEPYHQDYFANNPNAGYCQFVIKPKLKKLNLKAATT